MLLPHPPRPKRPDKGPAPNEVATGAMLEAGKVAAIGGIAAPAPRPIAASLTTAVTPLPHAWLMLPAPAEGIAPSIPVVPTNGSSPATERGPSNTFSETIVMPVGAMAEVLVTAKPPPLVAVNSKAGECSPSEDRPLAANPGAASPLFNKPVPVIGDRPRPKP